jgi:gamma-glutamyltranspeptidase/glutathione hydrolase
MSPFSSRMLGELVLPPTFREYCAGIMARGSLVKALTGLLTLQSALGTPVKHRGSYSTGTPSPPLLGEGQLGAVASESDICSHIGIELLKLGGNAADAMVGTVACVGVVGMYHSGEFELKTWNLQHEF